METDRDRRGGFGARRAAGLALDGQFVFVLIVAGLQMLSMVLAFTGWADGAGTPVLVTALFQGMPLIVLAGYVWWSRARGASPGRRLAGAARPDAVTYRPAPLPPPSPDGRVLAGARVGAVLLDTLFVSLWSVPMAAMLFFPLYGLGLEWSPDDSMGALGFAFLVWISGSVLITGLVYHWLGDAAGGTPGKRRAGLAVADLEGLPLGAGRSLVRQVVKLAMLVLVLPGVLVLAGGGRGWHDVAAGSVVVPRPR